MNKTKNEIRERNGKIIGVIAIIFVLVMGIGYLSIIGIIGRSIVVIMNPKKTQKINEMNLSKCESCDVPEFMIVGNNVLYVGGKTRKNKQYVYGLEIEVVESDKIQYEVQLIKNWQEREVLYEGLADLQYKSENDNQWKITNRYGIILPAYGFVDSSKNCTIIILISKSDEMTSSFSLVKEKCKNTLPESTEIMYYK